MHSNIWMVDEIIFIQNCFFKIFFGHENIQEEIIRNIREKKLINIRLQLKLN